MSRKTTYLIVWLVLIWISAWITMLFVNWALSILLIPSSINYWGGLFITVMFTTPYKTIFVEDDD